MKEKRGEERSQLKARDEGRSTAKDAKPDFYTWRSPDSGDGCWGGQRRGKIDDEKFYEL